ncbi:MAG: hypothetical protein PHG65_11090, partial [Kiritimatiellae bacterium]|nr:hypothetical protein [Kiritimatiellia bacterium]
MSPSGKAISAAMINTAAEREHAGLSRLIEGRQNGVMDSKTLNYYQKHADELADRYGAAQSGIAVFLEQAFAGKKTIIDVGCGTGRDLNTLLEMGFDACGVDPCQELLD